MNLEYFGDSYDLVKRFFVQELCALEYEVAIDPLCTGDWDGAEEDFFRLVGARHRTDVANGSDRRALLLDPDTGVNGKGGKRHVSFSQVVDEARDFSVVFAFDQAFSRQGNSSEMIQEKVRMLRSLGAYPMYYDSHARFLFVSLRHDLIHELWHHLVKIGLPKRRLIR